MVSERWSRGLRTGLSVVATLVVCSGATAFGQAAPQRLWQVRFDLDHRDDRATVGAFVKGDVVAGGTTRLGPANGGDKLTWLARWKGESGVPRWSRDVDGIGVPVALEANRRRLFLAGYGRRPLQALSARTGRTLWESSRGGLLTLTWLDVGLQGRVVYAAGSQRAHGRPAQVALEARRARNGEVLWSVREPVTAAAGAGWDEARMLAVEGTRLFVAGSQTGESGAEIGFVSSRRASNGEELWRLQGPELRRLEGMVASGDSLILVQSAASEGSGPTVRVTGLNASSGAVLWVSERGAGFPIAYKPGGAVVSGDVLVLAVDIVGGQGPGQPNDLLFVGLRVADGSELWADRVAGAYPSGDSGVVGHGTTVLGGGILAGSGGAAERLLRGYGRSSGGLRWELTETPFFADVLTVRGNRLLMAGFAPESPTDAIVRVYSLPPG